MAVRQNTAQDILDRKPNHTMPRSSPFVPENDCPACQYTMFGLNAVSECFF